MHAVLALLCLTACTLCGALLSHGRHPRRTFITFATTPYMHRARHLCESAVRCGFASARVVRPEDLDAAFVRKHGHILTQKRGAGYWLWKPLIIKRALDGLAEGEHLCYCDALYAFVAAPCLDETTLYKNKPGQGGVRFPVKKFTKMDVLRHFGATTTQVMNDGQLWAGLLYIVKDPQSVALVNDWLESCKDAHLLTDSASIAPNDPEFVDHRHDQSLLDLWARVYRMRVQEAPTFLRNLQHQRPV